MKKLSVFNTNFQSSIQNVVHKPCDIEWQPFEYKAKFEKRPLLFRSKKRIFYISFTRLYEKSFLRLTNQ